jgi:hypothetical protein
MYRNSKKREEQNKIKKSEKKYLTMKKRYDIIYISTKTKRELKYEIYRRKRQEPTDIVSGEAGRFGGGR